MTAISMSVDERPTAIRAKASVKTKLFGRRRRVVRYGAQFAAGSRRRCSPLRSKHGSRRTNAGWRASNRSQVVIRKPWHLDSRVIREHTHPIETDDPYTVRTYDGAGQI
jgi:hypothetical protein